MRVISESEAPAVGVPIMSSTRMVVPPVLAATDLMAMLPRQSIAAHAHLDLVVFPPPVAVDGFTLNLAWHVRQNLDRAVQYVCGIVRETFDPARVQSCAPLDE
jgi:DNA-binding transcriptional LysR family regulator